MQHATHLLTAQYNIICAYWIFPSKENILENILRRCYPQDQKFTISLYKMQSIPKKKLQSPNNLYLLWW